MPGSRGDMGEQRALQVGAVRGEIGRLPAPFGRRAELHAAEFGEARGVAQHHRVGPHRGMPKAGQHAEAVEDARGVGRELDAGADLVEPRRALEDAHRIAAHGKGERRRQPGDAGAGDDDLPGARLSHGRPV